MEREDVIAQIDDWERRLEVLYGTVELWFKSEPSIASVPTKNIYRGSVLQRDEPLMRQFDVAPRMLPTLALIYGKNRLSFVPSVLWIVGANGRVNLTVGGHQHILVDLGREGGESNWQIVTANLKSVHRPFDQNIFTNLVLHQAIEAA